MTRIVLPVVFAAAVLASGVAHGLSTGRWGTSADVTAAVDRMKALPRSVGDWRGDDMDLDPGQVNRAGIQGHVLRRYTNARDGRRLTLMLACGRPGPIAVHTPDVCYGGAGYERVADPTREEVRSGQFWAAQFHTPGAARAMRLDVFWAWSAADGWRAASNPRLEYARRPALYKLYVIREVPPDATLDQDRACRNFLECLLPDLDRALKPN